MKKRNIIVILVILIMIIAICFFAFTGNNKKSKENTQTSATINLTQNETIIENIVEEEENTQNMQENQDNTVVEENKQIENKTNNTTSEVLEDTPATSEEKAINIVKKDCKDETNIEITVEGMNENGDYIVVVRNAETTEAKAFYSVNITSQTFTKKEMN